MPQSSSEFTCQQCDAKTAQWLGRCPSCGAWGTLVETVIDVPSATSRGRNRAKPQPVLKLADVVKADTKRHKTEISELDRVLGGGLLPGQVILLAGNPGIGKSTLLLQLAISSSFARDSKKVLYIAAEESAAQIRTRADRMHKIPSNLFVASELDTDNILHIIHEQQPSLVIVDSIQAIQTSDLSGTAGSIGQVRECAQRLTTVAKQTGTITILVGHVTKTGNVAGPMTLEHVVDTVLYLEGDERSATRTIRSLKHRFGPTNEIGFFSLRDDGFHPEEDASTLLFQEATVGEPGAAFVPAIHGRRVLFLEIQALVAKSPLTFPRRIGVGVDTERLHVLLAVLMRHLQLRLYDLDVVVNVVGGLSVRDPGVDLGICTAVFSSLTGRGILPKTAVVGEVGLLGELRPVTRLADRLREARRLGFTHVVGPGAPQKHVSLRSLRACMTHLFPQK